MFFVFFVNGTWQKEERGKEYPGCDGADRIEKRNHGRMRRRKGGRKEGKEEGGGQRTY